MNDQMTRRQHYISRGLLTLFSEDKKNVVECDIDTKKIYIAKTENAMVEKGVYECSLLAENTLENAFAKIESSFIPEITNVVNLLNEGKMDLKTLYQRISHSFDIFLLFYYRSGALLSEFSYGLTSDFKKKARITRLLEVIADRKYLNDLATTLKCGYTFSLLNAENDSFVLSDQYISTVALGYKNQFINSSNRAMGMIDTMILLPLSSSYYIVLFHGRVPDYIKANSLCRLTSQQVHEINTVIFHNSFRKCVSSSKDALEILAKQHYSSTDVVQTFYKDEKGGHGGYTNKKEVFFYKEDEEISIYRIEFAQRYISAIHKYGKGKIRNAPCPCGSERKFKSCCLDKYRKAYEALADTQQKICKDYKIGNYVSEMPINEFWEND